MKRMLGIVIILNMITLLITLGVQHLGFDRGAVTMRGKLPSVVEFWHLRDCRLPCWAGIEIGATPLDVAYQQVRSLYSAYAVQDSHADDRFELTILDADGQALGTIMAFADTDGVQRITLDMVGDNRLKLGDSLAIYGQPTCAAPSLIIAGIDTVVLDEQPSDIRIYNVVRRRHVQSPLEQLVFAKTQNGRRLCGSMYTRWHGFTYP